MNGPKLYDVRISKDNTRVKSFIARGSAKKIEAALLDLDATYDVAVRRKRGKRMGSSPYVSILYKHVIDESQMHKAQDDTLPTNEDYFGDLTGNVLDNDFDPDFGHTLKVDLHQVVGPAGSTVTYTGEGLSMMIKLPNGSILSLSANGDYIFRRASGSYQELSGTQTEYEECKYVVGDNHGNSAEATLYIRIDGANDAPIALSDLFIHLSNDPTTIEDVADGCVLENDKDVDIGDVANLAVCVVNGVEVQNDIHQHFDLGQHTKLSIGADGCFTISSLAAEHQNLPKGETADVCFFYQACDGHQDISLSYKSNVAEACVRVEGVYEVQDYCHSNNGGCDLLTECINSSGGPTCGPCPPGYSGTGEIGCNDSQFSSISVSIQNENAAVIELTGVASGSFPAGFFEGDTILEVKKIDSAADLIKAQIFSETASVYNPTHQSSYHVNLRSSGMPSQRKFALLYLPIDPDFLESIPTTDQIEVFVRIEQSSDVEESSFPIFVLVDSTYDQKANILSVWVPSFSFDLTKDGDYSTDIFIASTPGRDSDGAQMASYAKTNHGRHLAQQAIRPVKCQGASLRCPLEKGCDDVSSPFDLNRFHPIDKVYKPHFGVDYGLDVGDNIVAASSGLIELVKTQHDSSGQTTGYGLYLVLRHNDGGATLYAHLSSSLAEIGEIIEEGQLIGLGGASGSATGPHLHFEYVPSGTIIRSKFRIDPQPCIASVLEGAIQVGDTGNDKDDSFKIFLSGGTFSEVFLGKTDVGASNNFAITNLRPGHYNLAIEVEIADDHIPTFGIDLFNGITFEDGTTNRDNYDPDFDRESFKNPGNRAIFVIFVPDNPNSFDYSCQDDNGNTGECLYTSSCQGSDRIAVPGFCPGEDDVQCCIKSPKCNSIGGSCKKESDCNLSTTDGLCPGDNSIKCCVREDECSSRDGECKSESDCAASNGLLTTAFCPDSSDACCVPAPTCSAKAPSGLFDGKCYQNNKSCIDGGGIPTYDTSDCVGFGPCCVFSADIPECLATDSAGQRYLPQDVFGECSLEQNCDTGPPSFMKRWTYSVGCPFPSNCCHTPPPPPCTPVPVSDVVSFLFYTRLYDEDISSDSIELEHEVEIDVQCDECDGTLIPKMISSKADITKNAFDSGYILPLDPISLSHEEEMLVRWVGFTWEGDWKSDDEDVFTAVAQATGLTMSVYSFGSTIVEASALAAAGKPFSNARVFVQALDYAQKNMVLPGGQHLFTAGKGLKNAGLVPIVGDVATLGFAAWDLFFDVETMFLYRNTVRFRCENRSGGAIPIASEVYGSKSRDENGNTYRSPPVMSCK